MARRCTLRQDPGAVEGGVVRPSAGVALDVIRPGKPTENSYIESFNSKLRDECLKTNQFVSLDDAKQRIEVWRRDYNTVRPHSSLGDLTPTITSYPVRQRGSSKRPDSTNYYSGQQIDDITQRS